MSDIEFGGCTVHRGTLDDPCPWCEIARLRAVLDAARPICLRWETRGLGPNLPGEKPTDAELLDMLCEKVRALDGTNPTHLSTSVEVLSSHARRAVGRPTMPDDILKWLRFWSDDIGALIPSAQVATVKEAADEIESLRSVLEAAREAVEEWSEFRDHEAEMTVLAEKIRLYDARDGEP